MTKKRARLLFIYVLLAGGAILCVMPMVYMLGISLKPSGALYEFPPHLFPGPEQLTLVNFEEILAQSKFLRLSRWHLRFVWRDFGFEEESC